MEKYGVDKSSVEDEMEKKAYEKKWPAPSVEEIKKMKGQKLPKKNPKK